MKQEIPWQCNNVLGRSMGKFFKINHHFIEVRQFNTAPAITISNILPWLTTQTVPQNMNCRGLWRSLPWYYLRSVAGGLIRFDIEWATYGTVYFIKFNVHGSVYRNNILIYKSQQDAHVTEFTLSDNCPTCFGHHCHPSSGAQNNCNYSIW